MPLVTLTTTAMWHPGPTIDHSSREARQIIKFGNSLPSLFVKHAKLLRLDENTSETAVQVSHRLAHPLDVNVPDLWIEVRFTEAGLDEVEQCEVVGELKKLIIEWFRTGALPLWEMPDLAVDCFWGDAHGFLRIGKVDLDW